MKVSKKVFFSALLSISLLSVFSFALGAYAASDVKLWINGKLINTEVKVEKGVTYVPLRVVSESLGADVKWDSKANVVSIVTDGNEHKYTASPSSTTTNTTKKKISDPSMFNYSVNSADGVKLTWLAKNNTGKKINYYTLHISTYNAVGDPSYDQITGKSTFSVRYVGPVEDGGDMAMFDLFTYQGAIHTIKIDDILLEYSDGTKETVKYGLKTTDDSGYE